MKLPEQVLDEWFEQVWNRNNLDHIAHHMSNPCMIHGLPEAARTHEGFAEFQQGLRAAIVDLHVEVVESLGDAERALGICRITGSSRAGAAVDFYFGYSAVVKNERIVEARNVVDFLSYLQQVGAVESELLGVALATK